MPLYVLRVCRQITPVLLLALYTLAGSAYGQDASAPAAAAPAPAAGAAGAAPGAAAPAAGGADAAKGEAIFTANCKQCHAFNEVVVGPALAGAVGRWPSEAALATFIKYPQKTIDGGNAYAKGLYDKYKQYMPNHDFLADGDIKAVIAYIKTGGAAAGAPAAGATATAKTDEKAPAGSIEVPAYFNVILFVLVLVLVIVMVVMLLLVGVLNRQVASSDTIDEDDKEFISQKTDWGKIFSAPAFRTVVIIAAVLLLGKVGYDKVYSIGINQGYAPKQPIAYSHKLHAGMYEIDCNYCHTEVYKGKRATIPSANICMNCHNAIKTESPEIRKIWRAVERNEPIQWVRVHNLPDLAYFNHAQHTKVGNVECATCHGEIKNMEVVQQHSSLTMGWCINCHRQTAVNAKGNAYYDKLLYLHKQTRKGEMKVADIGGLECSKCHY